MQEIQYRKCTPQDVNMAVPLIYSSGPAAFSYVFNNKKNEAQDFLQHAFLRPGGEFSYDNHYGLALNGQLVGIGAVFNAKSAKRFSKKDFLNIISFYKKDAVGILFRGLRTEQVIRLPKKKEICLAHLGIAESHRSKGLGQQLISYLMQVASPKAQEYFILDVSVENPRAKSLYNRLGFQVHSSVASTLKNKHGHVAMHYRMHKLGS